MRRRLNIKLLVVLLLAATLLGGGVHLVHGFQEKRSAVALLKRADQAERKGDLEQTEKYLGRYLGFRPDDADALARYGLILAKQDTSGEGHMRVLLTLNQALRRAPDPGDALRRDVRRRVVDLLMRPELGRFKDAREHLDALLKASPDDGELERLLGQCFEAEARTGRRDEAEARYRLSRNWYERSIRHAPGQIDGYVRLAGLLRGPLKDPTEADRLMDRLITGDVDVPADRADRGTGESQDPRPPRDQAQAHLARARYRREIALAIPADDVDRARKQEREDALAGADDDVDQARELAPDEADVLVAAAESARDKGDLDGARQLLERGMGLHPQDARMYRPLAVLETQAARPEQAEAALRRGIEALPDEKELQWTLAELLIKMRKPGEARKVIAQLRKQDDVFQPAVDYLDARLLLDEGKRAQGVRLLERARVLLADVPALASVTLQADLLLAQSYEQLGNPERQLAACRRILALDPRSMPARLGQAAALLALGRLEEALAAYQEIAPQVPAARVAVARLLIAQVLRRPAEQRNWTDADRALDEAERATPDSVAVAILRADVLAIRGQVERARALLERARDRQPQQVAPWIALAGLAGGQGQPEAMLSILDEARRQLGDRVELRLARAGYWGRRGGAEATKALESLAGDLDQFSGEDRLRLEDGLAEAFARLGDLRQAERLWTRVADAQPDDLRAASLLFDLAFGAFGGDTDEAAMQGAVDRLRRIEGEDGSLWRYGEAARLIMLARRGDRGRIDEARALLAEVAKRRPEWSRVPLLQAEITELEGNPEQAIDHYLRAIERGDRQPHVIRRVVQLLNAHRRFAEAQRVVQKLMEQAPPSGTLAQLAAEMSLRHQDQQRALELASQAVSPNSRDYRDHLWLSDIYWTTQQPAKAEAALRRALELADDAPQAWIAWVRHLTRTDRKDQAEAAIRDAQSKLPPDKAPLALAVCYQVIGHRDRAEEQYLAARAAKPEDTATLQAVIDFYIGTGQAQKAEPLLKTILDARTRAAGPVVAWARRRTALVLAARGGYQQILEALALIEQNLRAQGGDEDQRIKALLLAKQPGGRQEAIRTFEELARRQAPTPDEKFLLAQLYATGHELPKARNLMLEALADQGDNPLYLAFLTRVLLLQGQVDEAQLWLAKLERLQPQQAQTQELKARLLAAQGRDAEAIGLLKAYAQAKGAPMGPIAGLLEELGRSAQAKGSYLEATEGLYRQYASRSQPPEAVLALAGFLARRDRLPEALDLCDQAWQTCAPEVVGNASVTLLYAAGSDSESCRRVATRLEEAIRKDPNSTSLRFDLANVHILQGQYREAEAIYRQVYEQDSRNAGPLNNLAWLLALGQGKGTEAMTVIGRAIDLAGPQPGLLDTRAVVSLSLGRADDAIRDLQAAIAVRPMVEMYLHLAQAHLMAKDRRAAQEALRKAEAAGLKPERLHPLDRKSYDRLRSELDRG